MTIFPRNKLLFSTYESPAIIKNMYMFQKVQRNTAHHTKQNPYSDIWWHTMRNSNRTKSHIATIIVADSIELADPNMGLGTQNNGCYSTNSVYHSHNFPASVGARMFCSTIKTSRHRICIMAQTNAIHNRPTYFFNI